jgi:hypothetical protein
MGNEATLLLKPLLTDGRPAVAPNASVRVHDISTNQEFGINRVSFPPEVSLRVPAFPQSRALVLEISHKRYRPYTSEIFLLINGESREPRVMFFRDPGEWQAQFTAYAMLSLEFDGLKRILERSPQVRLRSGPLLGSLTNAAYDDIAEEKAVLAKAALLNLYLKLRKTEDPTGTTHNWFEYIDEIVEIDRERLVAKASPQLLETVRAIRANEDDFPDYKKAPSSRHFTDYPQGYTVTRSRTISVKTDEKKSNMQICAAPARDSDGNQVVLLDADIDENGELMAHLADMFRHKFTGGTHPFDIFDFLRLTFGREPIGYDLI